MKFEFWNTELQKATAQRNLLGILTLGLTLCTVLLSAGLFFKTEKIVLIPPALQKEIWIEGSKVSASYLEQLGLWHAHLVLEHSPATASYRRETLLRNVFPASYGQLKKQLLEEEEKLKKQELSTSFKPVSIITNENNLTVLVTGDLESFVGSKKINEKRESYKIEYAISGGLIQLKSFQLEVKNEF